MGLADMKILLRSNSCDTITGSTRYSDEMISLFTECGAEAVKAMNGATMVAR